MIQIKRLKQSGSEFVPITLAEAVVVNAENISGFEQITTLDKVLEQYCGLTAYTIASIENINKDLKNIDNTYQKKLTAGIGITITDDGIISASFETKGLSYKISIEGLPTAGKNCLDTIYLVPSKLSGEENLFDEFICYEDSGEYFWELIGSIPSAINFDGLVTLEQFDSLVEAVIMAEPIYNSAGTKVEIDIEIPKTLYDSY